MENPEKKKFDKIMKQAGLEKLIMPTGYRAKIRNSVSNESAVLGEFKTREEFEEWYKSAGAAYEDNAQGKIELEEIFKEKGRE